jgi:hypothetical protein
MDDLGTVKGVMGGYCRYYEFQVTFLIQTLKRIRRTAIVPEGLSETKRSEMLFDIMSSVRSNRWSPTEEFDLEFLVESNSRK